MCSTATGHQLKETPMKIAASAVGFVIAICSSAMLYSAERALEVTVVDQPAATSTESGLYVTNRAPLAPSRLVKLPIGRIVPKGWLRIQLENEANGMTGHLEELSSFCRFDGNAWVASDGQGANGWEEVPYWLKGYGDLGYVLKDERIIANARRWIDGVLSSQQADGYFGPISNKTSLDKPQGGGDGFPDLWPHMVMLNVLQSFYEFTDDWRI